MANLTLDLNIYSAKDLESVNIVTKMDVYAVASIIGDDTQKKNDKAKTPVDRSCGSNPNWNHAVKFSVNERLVRDGRLTLVVKLFCDRVLGDKEIGEVNVPILELLASSPPSPSNNGEGKGNGMKFVTYQVRTPSGRGKGSLTFSYRFDSFPVQSVLPVPPVYQNPIQSDIPSPGYLPPVGYPPQSGQPCSLYPDIGKLGEPVSTYPPPPGSSYDPPTKLSEPVNAYPPPPQHQQFAYPPQPPSHAYHHVPPPQSYYGHAPPPPPAYGYPPPLPGYGYGYPPLPQPENKNKTGLGFGAGLLGGAVGGFVMADIISDVVDMF